MSHKCRFLRECYHFQKGNCKWSARTSLANCTVTDAKLLQRGCTTPTLERLCSHPQLLRIHKHIM